MRWRLTQIGQYTLPAPDVLATGVAAGDIRGTSSVEVIVGGGIDINAAPPLTGRATCFNNDGSTAWQATSATTDYIMGLDIGDVDNDGNKEVLIGFRIVDHCARLFTKDGGLIWNYPMPTNCYVRAVRIGKLTADAGNQCFMAGALRFYSLAKANGTSIYDKQLAATGGHETIQSAVIADINENGQNVVVIGCSEFVIKLDKDGNEIWRKSVVATAANSEVYGVACGKVIPTMQGLQISAATAFAASGNNSGSKPNGVTLLDKDGNIIWVRYMPFNTWSTAIGYVAGLGNVVFASISPHVQESAPNLMHGDLVMLNKNGDPLASIAMPSSAKGMTFADWNLDGRGEVIATCDDGKAYVFSIGFS